MAHYQTLLRFVFSFAFATILITSVDAALVIQRAGETYVAWEAEDYWTNVAATEGTGPFGPWNELADAAASGGQVLVPSVRNTANPGGIAAYQLEFAEAGTYRLYFRIDAPDGMSDSMYRSAAFNEPPALSSPTPHFDGTTTGYEWYEDDASPADRYIVGAGDVGETLTLSVGSRESGDFRLDRFVLSTNTGLSDAQLDALFNWDTYNHFTGSVDTDWSNGDNWEFDVVPRSTTVAFIGDGKTAELNASAAVRQLRVGHTDATLPGDGTLSQSGGDMTMVERLAVGEMTVGSAGDNLAGSYTFAGGTLTVGQEATGRADLYIATNTVAGSANTDAGRVVAQGTLDLSGAEEFNAYLNDLVVGRVTQRFARGNGTLLLAGENTIDTTTFMISDLRSFEGRSASNDRSEVVLGQTNTIKTDLLTVGGQRGQGTLKFADGAENPTLTLSGSSGNKTNLRIGFTDADTSPAGSGTMDLSGGTFDATLGEVAIGYRQARGSGTATLTFDDGEVTADSLVLGSVSWATSNSGNATYTGILNMGGGTFTVAGDVTAGYGRNPTSGGTYTGRSSHGTGTINLSGGTFTGASLALGVGEEHPSVTARGTGTLNISGGAEADIAGNVTLGTGTVESTGRINITGGTLTGGGSVTGGPGSSTVYVDNGGLTVGGDLKVDALRVGYTEGIATVTAGGTVEIGSAAAPTDLFIGVTTSAKTVAGTLDLSGADSFTAYLSDLVLGRLSVAYAHATGTLKLAETNTIHANEIMISDIRNYQGSGDVSRIVLGQTNTIATNLLTVGGQRSYATLAFADGITDGILNLTGPAGGKADLRIAYTDSDTGHGGSCAMDLTGGTFNATLGEVVVGYREARGSGTATLSFDDGTVTADSLVLGSAGYSSAHSGAANYTGILNMGGGSLTVDGNVTAGTGTGRGTGTINLSGSTFAADSLALGVGEVHASGYVGQATGTLNISGGTAQIDDIALGTGTAPSTGTINLTGGTLMAQSISGGVGTANLNWAGGTLHVGTFGTVDNSFGLVQNGGTLAPGNSIGTTAIYGNYTMNDGTVEIEIASPGTGGIDYDLVMVDGDATLAGTLSALFLDDFVPEVGNRFDVLYTTGSLDIDDLALTVGPSSLTFGWWEMATIPGIGGDGFTLRLSAVPEPTGALLALLALAGLLGCLRPRRRIR
ncbi:MAG: hypothetical protein RBS80_06275 [Thermoguttaceae bacterium]|jgi:hypothetical protein|nr:hypothetical protein [Thermoguttaceae bacterium]